MTAPDLAACMDRHPSGKQYGRHALVGRRHDSLGTLVHYVGMQREVTRGADDPSHAPIDPLWALAAAEMVAADEAARRNGRAA